MKKSQYQASFTVRSVLSSFAVVKISNRSEIFSVTMKVCGKKTGKLTLSERIFHILAGITPKEGYESF